MIGEILESSTEDSKSFWSDSGFDSMVLCDEDNNWMMQANEDVVKFFQGILSWLDIIQNFEQLMQQSIEVLDNEDDIAAQDFKTEQDVEER